jgi:hypothetical protein
VTKKKIKNKEILIHLLVKKKKKVENGMKLNKVKKEEKKLSGSEYCAYKNILVCFTI